MRQRKVIVLTAGYCGAILVFGVAALLFVRCFYPVAGARVSLPDIGFHVFRESSGSLPFSPLAGWVCARGFSLLSRPS